MQVRQTTELLHSALYYLVFEFLICYLISP